MALTQYCELEEVRAALGVNEIELPDTVLSLPVYEIGLVRELAKVSASLPAAFLAILDTPESDWSNDQRSTYNAARLFNVYACARQVGVSLASMAPKDVTDGKASVSRFSDSPYRDTLARIEALLAGCRADLASAYSSLTGSITSNLTVPSVSLRASGRAYDPVTG